jgi:hypothetical protein
VKLFQIIQRIIGIFLLPPIYFTKWVEAIPLKYVTAEQIISFIDQFIITRFGLPSTLSFDNASYFSALSLTEYAIQKGIKLKH